MNFLRQSNFGKRIFFHIFFTPYPLSCKNVNSPSCEGLLIACFYSAQTPYCLPNYSGRVPLGAVSGINATVEAGLPNITGSLRYIAGPKSGYYAVSAYSANEVGCFGSEAIPNNRYFLPNGSLTEEIVPLSTTFDANRNSAIYGASTTVQPPAVKVSVLIKHD